MLSIGIVLSLGIAIVSAGLSTLFAPRGTLAGSIRLVALLGGLALVGYVIVRGALSSSQRSGVGYIAGGTPIVLSGAAISSAGDLDSFGTLSFVLGVSLFLSGAAIVFDREPASLVRLETGRSARNHRFATC